MIKLDDLSGGQNSVNKNIGFKTSMLKSDLFDYSDAYFVVKVTITVQGTANADKINQKLIFRNNDPFQSRI